MKKLVILVILCCCCSPILLAAGRQAGGSASRRDSAFRTYVNDICRFRLYGVELSDEVEKSIIFGVERICDTYEQTFGFEFADDFVVNITIIKTPEDFKRYQVAQVGEQISTTGYYTAMHNETVVWANTSVEKMLSVLFHEANHLILRYHIPYCPYWINEGLSEYFEGFNVIGRNKRVYLQRLRHLWVQKWLAEGFPISVPQYLALDYEGWEKFRDHDVNAAYTMGYSLVYFMMSHPKTEAVLKEILWELKRKRGLADSVRIVNETYPGGVRRFAMHWKRWIPRAREYRPLRVLRRNRREEIREEAAGKDEENASADK